MNIQQSLMNALGVGTPQLNHIINSLHKDPYIYGAKISGAGLGDCVIGLKNENFDQTLFPLECLPVMPALQGVAYE